MCKFNIFDNANARNGEYDEIKLRCAFVHVRFFQCCNEVSRCYYNYNYYFKNVMQG